MKQPASPAQSLAPNSLSKPKRVSAKSASGSVQWPKQSSDQLHIPTYSEPGRSLPTSPRSSASMNGSGKKVYQAFQRDRLIMGGEYWPSMINILTTALFAGIAVMRLDWHLLIEALCFGGPMQAMLRYYGHLDPDHFKIKLYAL